MRSYHITITMPDGSKARHCGLYRNGGAAASRATSLFPDAARIDVLRLTTVLLRPRSAPRRPMEAA